MKSKTPLMAGSRLAGVLPGHQFSEHHSGLVEAPREEVWDALVRLRWRDLRVTRPMMAVRGLGVAVLHNRVFETFTERAGAVVTQEPPVVAMLAMVGKPWSPIPHHVEVGSFDEISAFADPGWLKYGMEWVLHSLPDGRTLVETRTLCEATDDSARRAFGLYWLVVRFGSAAVRLEMIAALRRLTSTGRGARAPSDR